MYWGIVWNHFQYGCGKGIESSPSRSVWYENNAGPERFMLYHLVGLPFIIVAYKYMLSLKLSIFSKWFVIEIMHPFLQRQRLQYTIVVVNQTGFQYRMKSNALFSSNSIELKTFPLFIQYVHFYIACITKNWKRLLWRHRRLAQFLVLHAI